MLSPQRAFVIHLGSVRPATGWTDRGVPMRDRSGAIAILRRMVLTLGLVGAARMAPGQTMQVTTTTYSRNADGAVTAVTTQVDNSAASTVYVTWDNFLPNTGDPITGTVSAANGNLIGYGSTPGGSYATALQYDQRNRLTAATVADAGETYSYYAASRMAAATLASSDTLQFYYNTADDQVATNLYQPSTGTWSSYLDQACYLSDGTEQVRLQPRKDVAGQFDPATQGFTAMNYDPYGRSLPGAVPPTTMYDMTQNPFQYAGELKDPVWRGYYLRARWYFPDLQTFVSRDPGDKVRRYAYANANPIMNTDPSGLASRYTRDFGRPLGKLLKPLTTGPGGYILPLFLGSELTPLSILANPGGFWHSIQHDSHGTDIFLAATIVSETAGQAFGLGFRAKAGMGAIIGLGQAIGAGDNGARKPFDLAA